MCIRDRLRTTQLISTRRRVESSSFALNVAVRQISTWTVSITKKCLLSRQFNTEIGVFKCHIWTAESSLTNILATKLKIPLSCLLFVKFTGKISFFKCGTRTAYKILSVYVKSTSFCTDDACTEIDILCTEVDCTDISYVPKVTVPILTFNVPKPTVPKKNMYRKCMYRNCHVPKATYPVWNVHILTYKIIQTTVHRCCLKISCWLYWLMNASGVTPVTCRYFTNISSMYSKCYEAWLKDARLSVLSDDLNVTNWYEWYATLLVAAVNQRCRTRRKIGPYYIVLKSYRTSVPRIRLCRFHHISTCGLANCPWRIFACNARITLCSCQLASRLAQSDTGRQPTTPEYNFRFNGKWIFNVTGHWEYFSAVQKLSYCWPACSDGSICGFRQTESGCL